MARPRSPRSERRREREMQRELLKFHRDQTNPISTNMTKKRVREPRVEVEINPFCVERQLADSYQQLNFNKNPRFYSVSVHDGARVEQNPRNHSSFINQSTDLTASSNFNLRARPEFSTLPPATSYTPAVAHFTAPTIVNVDPSNLRLPLTTFTCKVNMISKGSTKASTRRLFPPGHDEYSVRMASQNATFGHRPNSAARMFDHLSNTVSGTNSPIKSTGKFPSHRASSTPVRTGMSVMKLAQLLASTTDASSSSNGKSSGQSAHCWQPKRTERSLMPCNIASLNDKVDDELKRQEASKKTKKARDLKMEKGFVNCVYNPPRELKPGHFLPPDQTTAQLIDKYRKLAVGKIPDTL